MNQNSRFNRSGTVPPPLRDRAPEGSVIRSSHDLKRHPSRERDRERRKRREHSESRIAIDPLKINGIDLRVVRENVTEIAIPAHEGIHSLYEETKKIKDTEKILGSCSPVDKMSGVSFVRGAP